MITRNAFYIWDIPERRMCVQINLRILNVWQNKCQTFTFDWKSHFEKTISSNDNPMTTCVKFIENLHGLDCSLWSRSWIFYIYILRRRDHRGLLTKENIRPNGLFMFGELLELENSSNTACIGYWSCKRFTCNCIMNNQCDGDWRFLYVRAIIWWTSVLKSKLWIMGNLKVKLDSVEVKLSITSRNMTLIRMTDHFLGLGPTCRFSKPIERLRKWVLLIFISIFYTISGK